MKKYLIILLLIFGISINSFASIVYEDTYYQRHLGNVLSGGSTDPIKLFINEVEGYLEGASAFPSLYFSPTDTAPTAAEGQLYYNNTGNVLKLYNGSAWVNLSISQGNSLDTAYDLGYGITVDGYPVTLTTGAAVNNAALHIVHGETTNDNDAIDIDNSADAATAVSIQIDGTAGYDIQGTGDTWNVSIAGAATFVGMTTSGELLVSAADVLFDGTYDVAWDTSRNTLIFQDNAILGIGGAHDAAPDVSIKWDASNMLIESAAEDTGEIRYGSTSAIDVAHYANTNTSIAKFNASTATLEFNGYDVQIMDDDKLAFGDSDEFVIEYDEDGDDDLVIVAGSANADVTIGDGTTNTDLKMTGATASTYVLWDASADELLFDLADLKISQGSQIEFIDVTDSATDWTIDNATDETLLIYPTETTDDQSINLGNADHTTDLRIFGKTASTVVFDASGDEVIFDAYDISLQDGDFLKFGDGDDFTLDSSTEKILDFTPAGATDDYKVYLGLDQSGVDLKIFGATTGEYWSYDASADSVIANTGNVSYTLTDAEVDQFKVDATGAAAGNVINFETTDGGILLNADGASNGDIELNSADDMTFTSAGNLTLAVTGTVSAGASAITNQKIWVEEITAATDTLTAAESGKLIVGDYTGTQTITLPDAAAGLVFGFVDSSATAADDLVIDPQAADTIDGDTAGHAIESVTDALGQSIWLVAIDGTQWITFNRSGTWGQQ